MSSTRLFVGNLPDNTNENELRTAFSDFGEIVNLDLKTKPGTENDAKKFAFVSISASNNHIESCIKHFSSQDFNGNKLYVTRARESFLERLQRERVEAQNKEAAKEESSEKLPKKNPVIKLSEKLNPRRRKNDDQVQQNGFHHTDARKEKFDHKRAKFDKSEFKNAKLDESNSSYAKLDKSNSSYYKFKEAESKNSKLDQSEFSNESSNQLDRKSKYEKKKGHSNTETFNSFENVELTEAENKKQDSDKKRLESMKKKREEFKKKQIIIKTGLVTIDKIPNKKVVFSDAEDDVHTFQSSKPSTGQKRKNKELFEDGDESDDDLNFEVKEQFEGRKGQKVLELQSRYKSDKRFMLDEKFIDDQSEEEEEVGEENDQIDVSHTDERAKQLNILQDVLGVAIKSSALISDDIKDRKRAKVRLGMPRFDPSQPEHAKFLAPVEETKPDQTKKNKKRKGNQQEVEAVPEQQHIVEKVEVSKEQFYTVSDSLKEAIAQPTSFSLRSLFGKDDGKDNDKQEQDNSYIPIKKSKEPRVKNPFEPSTKNPFQYDSSESEDEDDVKDEANVTLPEIGEAKAVWKENLFFSDLDSRLQDGLAFFNKTSEVQKERRGLRSLMKKRLNNRDRNDQNMFKKKIGGKRKSSKRNFRQLRKQ